MRVLSPLGKNKKALSNIIAYVLLISITVSLSVMVYSWLRSYVVNSDIKECPSGVNIVIKNYDCNNSNSDGTGGQLIITLKNKGLFKINGYILRVNDEKNARFGFYTIDKNGVVIMPGGEYTETYYFNKTIDGHKLNTVTLVDVQPFITDENRVSCKSYVSQKVECN